MGSQFNTPWFTMVELFKWSNCEQFHWRYLTRVQFIKHWQLTLIKTLAINSSSFIRRKRWNQVCNYQSNIKLQLSVCSRPDSKIIAVGLQESQWVIQFCSLYKIRVAHHNSNKFTMISNIISKLHYMNSLLLSVIAFNQCLKKCKVVMKIVDWTGLPY